MSDPTILSALPRDLFTQHSAFTSNTYELQMQQIGMLVIEIEDVLFHHNSAVMMPSRPAGSSSTDGDDDFDDGDVNGLAQDISTGIKALALVYKQFELDPSMSMVIAAHTDTSGQARYNFQLSEERGKNVLYLLTGDRENWAKICADKHNIEDYQQIMEYFALKYGWNCNPQGVDDAWGTNTENACVNFFTMTQPHLPDQTEEDRIQNARDLVNTIKRNGKKWPEEAWYPAFDLYAEELCNYLNYQAFDISEYADYLVTLSQTHLRFVSDNKKVLSCGESFPIDDAEKNNYRSQINRRVEILLFDEHEKPSLDCPRDPASPSRDLWSRTHRSEECPIWNKIHYFPLYIDPNDLYAVVYHFRFVYYDKIKKSVENIPEGLIIRAIENDSDVIPTQTVYRNGVYCVKVQYTKPLDDPGRFAVRFEFETANKWIYTANDASDPIVVEKTIDEVKAAPITEQFKYYDLPANWSSLNYWTRYDGDFENGELFDEVLKSIKQIKPFGGNTTSESDPLIFSLDDIVLLDTENGTQDIKDHNHETPPVEKALTRKSRVKILQVDDTHEGLKLYQTDPAKGASSRIPFSRNLITVSPDKLQNAKIVFFRDGFYPVGRKRTTPAASWPSNNHVVGARAAILNDSEYHDAWEMLFFREERGFTGDNELIYFHNMHVKDDHPVSYLLLYVSTSFMLDTRGTSMGTAGDPVAPKPVAADLRKYVEEGVYNAMAEWNNKQYFLEERTPGDSSTIIKIFYFFDERETFKVPNPLPNNINFQVGPATNATSNYNTLFANSQFNTARRNALGGKSRFIGIVCRDKNNNYGKAYHSNLRRSSVGAPYSIFKLNKSGYKSWPNNFTGIPVTEHGISFGAHTFAHELGHAVGNPDEYIKRDLKPDSSNSRSFPAFPQFALFYSMGRNHTSMMYHNAAPRLHHTWYSIYQLNTQIRTAGTKLNNLLSGKEFVARIKRGTFDLKYYRHVDPDTATHRHVPNNYMNAMHAERQFSINTSPRKRLHLRLYYVGEDESSIKYFHANQDAPPNPIRYQAVLVVRVMLSVSFVGTWTGAQKRVRLHFIDRKWTNLGEKLRLVGGSKAIENIYVHFLAGFTDNAGASDKNYRIKFHSDSTSPTGSKIRTIAGVTTIYRSASSTDIIEYFINGSSTANILSTFNYLKTWTDSKLGESFTLEQI